MIGRMLMAVVLVVAPATTASAGGVLATPPHGFASAALACTLTNIGKKTMTGHIEALNGNGEIVKDVPFTTPPNRRIVNNTAFLDGATHCIFRIDKGSKKDARAVMQILEGTESKFYILPAY